MAISECITYECGLVDELGREMLHHGHSEFPIGCYHDDLTFSGVPWHWHEELEFALVTEGETIVRCEDEQVRLRQGDGFFINSGLLHACDMAGEGPCRYHSMSFHARLVGGDEGSVFWERYLQPILSDARLGCLALRGQIPWQREILERIEQTWQACAAEESGYEIRVRSLLSEALFILLSHQEEAYAPGAGAALTRGRAGDHRLKEMIAYMQSHCAEPLTLEDIAGHVGISKSGCLRAFAQTISMSPMQYLKFIRIQKAAHLLTDTDRKIIDIGIECGFQDMSYFSRVFRGEKGCTPREYRQFSRRRDDA